MGMYTHPVLRVSLGVRTVQTSRKLSAFEQQRPEDLLSLLPF